MAEKPKAIEQTEYASQYGDQIAAGIQKVTDRQEFNYDPMQDVSYQALAKMYNKQGEQAAKNTMGDAAALNGGFGTSYAVTAAQQARNDYNQQLASQIPALKQAALDQYVQNYNMDIASLGVLQDADNIAYGRHRDTVADKQWQYGQDYQAYRDDIGDQQWQKSYDRSAYEFDKSMAYQKERDQVSDSQWAKEYELSKKSAASSGSGGGGGGNYYGGSAAGSGGSGGAIDDSLWRAVQLAKAGSDATISAGKKTTKKK